MGIGFLSKFQDEKVKLEGVWAQIRYSGTVPELQRRRDPSAARAGY